MARICGIRLGTLSFEMVVLDGTAKKPKLRHATWTRVAGAPADVQAALAETLKEHAKLHKKQLQCDDVSLCIDGGLGIYRALSLPFADKDKIEEVLKYEIESKIPQADIDDLICDFVLLEASAVESHLLVTAVPKSNLRQALDVVTKAGLEPIEAELETTALYSAAEFCEVLKQESAQCLVFFGDRSTSIVLVADGRIQSMRAMHLELIPPAPAAAAVAGEAPQQDAALAAAQTEAVEESLSAERRAQVLERVQKELGRMLTTNQSGKEFDTVWVCGRVPAGLLDTQIMGVPVQLLDPLAELDPEREPLQRTRYAVAFGSAWRQMGGGSMTPHLRREDLAFAGTFERLELPMGVLGLLLLTYLASQFIITKKLIVPRQMDFRLWMEATRNYTVGEPEKGEPGYIATPPEDLTRFMREALAGKKDEIYTPVEQLQFIESKLVMHSEALRKKLGTSKDLEQPASALSAVTLVLGLFEEMGPAGIGRFAIRKLEANFRPAVGNRDPEMIVVKLDLTFFDDGEGSASLSASRHYNDWITELESKPWCIGVEQMETKAFTAEGGGIYTDGVQIKVDPRRAPVVLKGVGDTSAAQGAPTEAAVIVTAQPGA